MRGIWVIVLLAAGCRTDFDDWSVTVIGTNEPVPANLQLVVGQTTSLALALQSHESNYYYPPKNVRFIVDHPTTLEVTVVGDLVIDGETRNATQVDLVASMVGPNRIRFISDSTDEPFAIPLTGVSP